ncbi:hypothetical protein BJP36_26925 [Moorena producens JHB]|uniref:Uncharacterized protein n=1 Tax=Moorena producens (strain JHB) TaxID=1454205 RepID=A0A9Q9SSS7_MOOP1|nr:MULTISPECIES: hypothetical protein [Moorena]WAN68967.1 hypothetical protein BJP36_26925 [Moorena producens JHB]
MGETTAVAHGGNHGSRSWGGPPRPRCLPKTALPPQDRAASPRPRCIAADGGLVKTVAGRVTSPYLLVVEAQKGTEAINPLLKLYGQILGAACLNSKQN